MLRLMLGLRTGTWDWDLGMDLASVVCTVLVQLPCPVFQWDPNGQDVVQGEGLGQEVPGWDLEPEMRKGLSWETTSEVRVV